MPIVSTPEKTSASRPRASVGQFVRFGVVGSLGFLIDTALTLGLIRGLEWTPPLARVPAFLLASLATYALNRTWTFRSGKSVGFVAGWLRYVVSTVGSSMLNYLVYFQIVSLFGNSTWQIAVGIALGSLLGLLLNFTVSNKVVFRG